MRVFASVLIVILSLASRVNAARIPSVIAHPLGNTFPLWVSAEAARLPNGKIDETRFHPANVASLRDALKNSERLRQRELGKGQDASSDNCYVFLGRVPENLNPNNTFGDLLEHSRVIIAGRIAAISQGFFHGNPGSLLLLTDSSQFKKSEPRNGRILLFYPAAQIALEGGQICAKPMVQIAAPAVGDRVAGFAMDDALCADGMCIYFFDERREIVLDSARLGIQVPEGIRKSSPGIDSFDRLLGSIGRAVGGPTRVDEAQR